MNKKETYNPHIITTTIPLFDESGFSAGAGIIKSHIPYGKIDNELDYSPNRNPLLSSLENLGYALNERQFKDIKPLFSEDYKKFKFPYPDDIGVYFGAEHSPKNLEDKLANLTFFGNLEATLDGEPALVMASSMGHFHPLNLGLQEIYEFKGYGAIVIQHESPNVTEIIFMEPGGIVGVPGRCNMTIYNLDNQPLETHDFANPKQNTSHKDIEKQKGPIFCIYYVPENETIFFDFNKEYIGNTVCPPSPSIKLKIPKNASIGNASIGKAVYNAVKNNPDFTSDFGRIKIKTSSELSPIKGIRKGQSLKKAIHARSQEFYNLFRTAQKEVK